MKEKHQGKTTSSATQADAIATITERHCALVPIAIDHLSRLGHAAHELLGTPATQFPPAKPPRTKPANLSTRTDELAFQARTFAATSPQHLPHGVNPAWRQLSSDSHGDAHRTATPSPWFQRSTSLNVSLAMAEHLTSARDRPLFPIHSRSSVQTQAVELPAQPAPFAESVEVLASLEDEGERAVCPQTQKIASKPTLVAGFPKSNEKETPSFSVPRSSLKKAPVCSEPSEKVILPAKDSTPDARVPGPLPIIWTGAGAACGILRASHVAPLKHQQSLRSNLRASQALGCNEFQVGSEFCICLLSRAHDHETDHDARPAAKDSIVATHLAFSTASVSALDLS
jgi:hypothetical protein